MDRSRDGRNEPRAFDLEEFLRMLPFLDVGELMAISAAYRDGSAEARELARASAAAVAKRRGLTEELTRIQSSIVQWATSDMSRSSQYTMERLGTNLMLGDIRMEALAPLLDAATALLLNRSLTDEERELLLEPLTAAVG
jgi:hypothetical protein